MYDGDQTLCYTGTLYWDGGPQPSEDARSAVLGDGKLSQSCVTVRYEDRTNWDVIQRRRW